MGTTSKSARGSSILFASFKDYFCRGRTDEGMAAEDEFFCETARDGRSVTFAVDFSAVDLADGGQWVHIGEDSSSLKKDKLVPPVEMNKKVKAKGVDSGNDHTGMRIPSPPSKRTGSVTSSPSGKHVALKEIALSILSSSKRKRYRAGNESMKDQNRKDPLVILAWANWVSYESDEEIEEPLVKRRSETRRRERRGEVLQFERALNLGQVAALHSETKKPAETL